MHDLQRHKVPKILTLILVLTLILSLGGFTGVPTEPSDQIVPNAGAGDGEMVDVIQNGGFEERPTDPGNGVATNWEAFSNGQAHFGWYDETWPEAVKKGEHAQLLEIFEVEANVLDRFLGIYQTVNVIPNSTYNLQLYALMRSEAPKPLRNQNEYEMHWGVDYSGQSNYENVTEWVIMPLTEQLRIGSQGTDFSDQEPLFYEKIEGTINTGDSSQITLFIRGLKKFPNGTEILYDIDQVSLVGPVAATPASTSVASATPTEQEMPETGFVVPTNLSTGSLVLGSLIIVVLGAGATASLLKTRNKYQ
ncbi:MAG: hypothetical protein AAF485_12725 [Chloroflexota bacterium]